MNIIKYLKKKNNCPLCNSTFRKYNGEIFCEKCGLLVLDYYPVTSENIENAFKLAELEKKEKKGDE